MRFNSLWPKAGEKRKSQGKVKNRAYLLSGGDFASGWVVSKCYTDRWLLLDSRGIVGRAVGIAQEGVLKGGKEKINGSF